MPKQVKMKLPSKMTDAELEDAIGINIGGFSHRIIAANGKQTPYFCEELQCEELQEDQKYHRECTMIKFEPLSNWEDIFGAYCIKEMNKFGSIEISVKINNKYHVYFRPFMENDKKKLFAKNKNGRRAVCECLLLASRSIVGNPRMNSWA